MEEDSPLGTVIGCGVLLAVGGGVVWGFVTYGFWKTIVGLVVVSIAFDVVMTIVGMGTLGIYSLLTRKRKDEPPPVPKEPPTSPRPWED